MPKNVSPVGFEGAYNVRAYGAKGDNSTNDQAAIQAALTAAATAATSEGGATVVIPPGKYKISSGLLIKSDVTLMAYGAYIFAGAGNFEMLKNYEGGESGYTGKSRITVLGGTWDGKGQSWAVDNNANIMAFINCKDIVVRDATIRNVASYHAIELQAVDGAVIDSCRFEGFKDNTTGQVRVFSEAIQLDISGSSTACKNVNITNCYQGAAEDGSGLGVFGRLVGSHTDAAGLFHTGIRVIGNTSNGSLDNSIQAYSWTDSIIANNTLLSPGSVGDGSCIEVTGNASNVVQRIVIDGNTCKDFKISAVFLNGASGREIRDTTISNNVITASANTNPAIYLDFANYCTVIGNTLGPTNNRGITISASHFNNINGNTIRSTGADGIYLGGSAQCLVGNNRISDTGWHGILIGSTSQNNFIQGNYIRKAGAATHNTYSGIQITNQANNDNCLMSNRIQRGETGTGFNAMRAAIEILGTTPVDLSIIFNSFEGWTTYSATAASSTVTTPQTTFNNVAVVTGGEAFLQNTVTDAVPSAGTANQHRA
ncbi:right-handed parallel beta-helix repeat-containing protein [Streptomyces sp. NPDC015131]|uniref:right-handed parallel beta-helix repeat-containing protein n=1 Tax=Streptomyces sp. NPDC015131 TaxID=3364941 RepID=UPI0036F6DDDB